MNRRDAKYPCSACGFVVFSEPPGSYDICPICKWEDDVVQLESPGYVGGANHRSLAAHQISIALKLAPIGISLLQGYRRDPAWRPVMPSDSVSELPTERFDATDDRIYYWRRSRPTI